MTDLTPPENPQSTVAAGAAAPRVPLPLKIAVYGMGGILVVMMILVAGRFMDRREQKVSSATSAGVPWTVDLELSGGLIKSAVLDGRMLTLVVERDGAADSVVLIDTKKGQVVGKIQLATP